MITKIALALGLTPTALVAAGAPLFAQDSPMPAPGAAELFSWLSCGCAVMGIAVLAKQLFWKSPSNDAHYATKAELKEHAEKDERTHENIFTKIGGHERGLAIRVGKIETDMAAVKKEVEISGTTLVRIEDKLDKRNYAEARRA